MFTIIVDEDERKAARDATEDGILDEADASGRYVAFLPPSHGTGDRGKALVRAMTFGPVYLSLLSITPPAKKGGIFIPKYRFITDSEWDNYDLLQAQFTDRNMPTPPRTGPTQELADALGAEEEEEDVDDAEEDDDQEDEDVDVGETDEEPVDEREDDDAVKVDVGADPILTQSMIVEPGSGKKPKIMSKKRQVKKTKAKKVAPTSGSSNDSGETTTV